jgi:GT2 family glycosyltransferase
MTRRPLTQPNRIPAVSIVMPAHNTEPYIGEAIDSALKQSWSDFELIVVDDGSSDATAEVASGRAARDSRIVVLSRVRGGPSAARNSALGVARAPVFALLDSDDIWAPTFLEEQLAILDTSPEAAIVTANAISLGGSFNGQPLRPTGGECRRLSPVDILECEEAVCIMSVFRREVVERIGGFDERLRTSEDYQFWIRAVLAGFGIVQNPRPLGFYRRRPDGNHSVDELRSLAGLVRVFEEARSECGNRPAERAAIDRQIERFARELLAVEAKTALRRRDFRMASDRFKSLHQREGGTFLAAIAAVCTYAPVPLFWFDRVREAVRRGRRSRLVSPSLESRKIASPTEPVPARRETCQ